MPPQIITPAQMAIGPAALVDSLQGMDPNKAAIWVNSDLDMEVFRVNTLLQKDEWKALDTVVIQIARERLNIVNDLRAAGLVRELGGLGVTIDEWETSSDMSAANVDMSGATRGDEDSVSFSLTGVPIPIIHKNYRINIRRLLASRKQGTPIDTTQAAVATRKVAEKAEDMVLNGVSVKVDSRSLYGLTNFPQRTQVTISGNWDTTPANIIADVEAMLQAADLVNHYGPFNLYVPTKFWSALREDYSIAGGSMKTYMQRLLDYLEINSVKPCDRLTYNNVVMVEMSAEVIDLSVGQDITNLEWSSMGGLVSHYKIMTALAPRCKADDNGNSGIIHGST